MKERADDDRRRPDAVEHRRGALRRDRQRVAAEHLVVFFHRRLDAGQVVDRLERALRRRRAAHLPSGRRARTRSRRSAAPSARRGRSTWPTRTAPAAPASRAAASRSPCGRGPRAADPPAPGATSIPSGAANSRERLFVRLGERVHPVLRQIPARRRDAAGDQHDEQRDRREHDRFLHPPPHRHAETQPDARQARGRPPSA